jgi:hypothetical protein
MKTLQLTSIVLLLSGCLLTRAQTSDLEAMLEQEMEPRQEYVLGTFVSSYVLNNPSVEFLNKHGLNIRISHKFGLLNSGADNFFGFDHSSAYMGLEYAPIDWLNIGMGRGTFRESVNAHTKFRLLRQTEGSKNFPFTLAVYAEMDYKTKEYIDEAIQNDRTGRLEYTSQLLIARKFGKLAALQVMPGYLHRNLVETRNDPNGIAFVGIGGTLRLSKSVRMNAEYFWVQEHDTPLREYFSPVSVGISYQTSRHAFELFATNSSGITSNNFLANTTNNFFEGDICIAFNVSIVLSVKK